MVKKSVAITKRQDEWLKSQAASVGITEAEFLRRLLDALIESQAHNPKEDE